MINVQEFLKTLNIDVGIYALVTYNERKEAIYFSKHFNESEQWFLESPCELFQYGDEYEIENFQCSPYLPEEVEAIETISQEACLDYLVKIKRAE